MRATIDNPEIKIRTSKTGGNSDKLGNCYRCNKKASEIFIESKTHSFYSPEFKEEINSLQSQTFCCENCLSNKKK